MARRQRRHGTFATAAALLGFLFVTANAQALPIYVEVGDASNDVKEPTSIIAGGPYEGVQGIVGGGCGDCGTLDRNDFYLFQWAVSGAFTATGSVTALVPDSVNFFTMSLWDPSMLDVDDFPTLIAGPSFAVVLGTPQVLSVPFLAAGNYIFQVHATAEDPAYLVTWPTTQAAVPESGTLLLVAGPIAALAVRAGRRRRAANQTKQTRI